MDVRVEAYLRDNHRTIMSTVSPSGEPHVARVDVGLVEGKLWSSATIGRVRTRHLRNDPRAALAVLHHENSYQWLGLSCRVTILDGPDAPELNLALYRTIAKEPDDVKEYLEAMVKEERIIYEFEILRSYGEF